ncbi:hypothetical protein ACTRXD_17515 [Nitrospira sp. T9]|uniref:hypothetical protein n=1 Tax=Nitrospira sp. T9 TaxID=3456077 RepID=UPI003F94C9CD
MVHFALEYGGKYEIKQRLPIVALLANKELADQVWELLWAAGLVPDYLAATMWLLTANCASKV